MAEVDPKNSKLLLVYFIVLTVVNASIVIWTYPEGGYGAIAALIVAPIANAACLLIFMGISFLLKDKTIKQGAGQNQTLVFLAVLFVILVYVLAGTVYSRSGS